jgi:NAD(P)H dehydrogenase (quinone)
MKVLIVCATMSGRSFNASMLDTATVTLQASGHEVRLSNLQAMNFDPVTRPKDFAELKDPAHIRYDLEQRYAVEQGAFSDDIASELDKLLWCDCLILQFPLYWFSFPAIIK